MRGDLQINSGSAPSGPWSLSHVPAGEQLVDNGVFHHRRSIGPSAASAKTCSTGCSMVQSSLAPFKKMGALYTVHIGFNLHNMDKMSISNHVSTVDRSARNSTAPVPSFCVQHRSIRNRLSLTRCFTCVASKLSKQTFF